MADELRHTIGIFYTWWRGDPMHRLPPAPGVAIAAVDPAAGLPVIDGLNAPQARDLQRDGHRLYLARLAGEIAAHGWCATRKAAIGELGVEMTLSSVERYLWGFETHPSSRGQGLYTRLLQAIIDHDPEAERFWIGHDIGNTASARGILRAGFQPVGEVYQHPDGSLRYVVSGHQERAIMASRLLGIPVDADRDGAEPEAQQE